jgi:hypothetical protein
MVLNLQLRYVLDSSHENVVIFSEETNATLYFSHLNQYAQELQMKGKGVVFIGENFVFGLLGKLQLDIIKVNFLLFLVERNY